MKEYHDHLLKVLLLNLGEFIIILYCLFEVFRCYSYLNGSEEKTEKELKNFLNVSFSDKLSQKQNQILFILALPFGLFCAAGIFLHRLFFNELNFPWGFIAVYLILATMVYSILGLFYFNLKVHVKLVSANRAGLVMFAAFVILVLNMYFFVISHFPAN